MLLFLFIAPSKHFRIFALELISGKTNGDKMKSLTFFTKNEQSFTAITRYYFMFTLLLICDREAESNLSFPKSVIGRLRTMMTTT